MVDSIITSSIIIEWHWPSRSTTWPMLDCFSLRISLTCRYVFRTVKPKMTASKSSRVSTMVICTIPHNIVSLRRDSNISRLCCRKLTTRFHQQRLSTTPHVYLQYHWWTHRVKINNKVFEGVSSPQIDPELGIPDSMTFVDATPVSTDNEACTLQWQ